MTSLVQAKPATVPPPDTNIGLRRPRLRLYFYSAIASDTIVFYTENDLNIWLRGPLVNNLLPQILPLLNGTLTPNEIIERVGSDQRKQVLEVLKVLKERDIIEEGDPLLDTNLPQGYLSRYDSQIRYFSHYHNEPLQAQAHLKQATVTVLDDRTSFGADLVKNLANTGLGELRITGAANLAHYQPTEPSVNLAELQENAPFSTISAHTWGYDWIAASSQINPPAGTPASYRSLEQLAENSNLVVVLTEGFSTRICDVVNELALKKGFRWLNISLKGSRVLVGPGVLPNGTACWRCYMARVWGNQAREESYGMLERIDEDYHAAPQGNRYGTLPGLGQLAASLGTNEILKALTLYSAPLYGRLLIYDAVSLNQQNLEVLRLPRCKACGRDRVKISSRLWYTPRPLGNSTGTGA